MSRSAVQTPYSHQSMSAFPTSQQSTYSNTNSDYRRSTTSIPQIVPQQQPEISIETDVVLVDDIHDYKDDFDDQEAVEEQPHTRPETALY